ncbi:MAG: DUF1800 domain-containing protein [Microscillaceae bacterium]|jgi:uncharacterized protein (DUF1800 family)|nr:DUF1800 domain-containing protein [Microscillaceae bacterium]
MPLPQFSGSMNVKQAAHLLRRATFGPTKAQIDFYTGKTAATLINDLFTPTASQITSPPLTATGLEWVNRPDSALGDIMDSDLQDSFKGWWLGKMLLDGLATNRPSIFEKIVFFLHTHFTTNQEKVSNARALYYQNQLFRQFAFDRNKTNPLRNFKELAKKICIENAMLVFLDGFTNVKGSVNENFAREFFELYTVGKGLDNVYPATGDRRDYFYFTEDDIREAAKIFSGFITDFDFINGTKDTSTPARPADTGLPRGKAEPALHDNTVKQFSPRFNNQTITPTTPENAPTEVSMLRELDDFLDMIFAKDETDRNICRKIYRFFVYYRITPEIENNIISEMVNTFVSTGYRIEPVIRELLGSQHFFEAAAGVTDDKFGAIIKSPLELILGTLRFFELDKQVPNYQTQTANFYALTGQLFGFMQLQGLNFLNPFDVAGYEAYFQVPIYNRAWISTNSLTRRYEFVLRITESMSLMQVFMNLPDSEAKQYYFKFFKAKYPQNASVVTPNFVIREITKYLFPLDIENTEITDKRYAYFYEQFIEAIKAEFAQTPGTEEAVWANEWNSSAQADLSNNVLVFVLNKMLQTPEYQLF